MKISGLRVVDAKRDQTIRITNRDVKKGGVKDPATCAAALACRRDLQSAEAQVHIGRTYVKQGRKWVRYVTPASLKYEIVAFDRGGKFEPGEYVLLAPRGALSPGIVIWKASRETDRPATLGGRSTARHHPMRASRTSTGPHVIRGLGTVQP